MTNEAKQGGILSPALFNAYMNNLSLSLNHSGIGSSLINHLCYADDLCLIALSSSGMQCLLDICDKYSTGHQLTYNATKSFTLCFKLKHIKIGLLDFVLGKHVIPAVDKCKYLGIIVSEANCDGELTLSDPGYFRQLTISKTIASIFTISYMCILPGVLGMIQLEFFKNSRF